VTARTDAVRGTSRSSAISPNDEPGPSRRCEARELDGVREALAKAGYAVTAGPEALDRLNRLRSAYLDDLCALTSGSVETCVAVLVE